MSLKAEFDDLWDLKIKIQSKNFQERIIKPLYEEIDKLKSAYDCKTLTELSELRGKKWGLNKMIDIFKDIEVDLKNKKDELDSAEDK